MARQPDRGDSRWGACSRAEFPYTATGKDYLWAAPLGKLTTGTGGQSSLSGVCGAAAGIEEGAEVNPQGLNLGVDPRGLALTLPLTGRIGPREEP